MADESKEERAGDMSVESEKLLFTNHDLKQLILPLFFEQFLMVLVGMADVFVVGFVGEAAVSGVSLVNSFNLVFLNLFTALAAGGAVVISQFIGRGRKDCASRAASQLLTSSTLFSVAAAILTIVFHEPLLRLMFGRVEEDVMQSCVIYLRISAYSYPALAIYNAGAALYRSFGKTSTTMRISVLSNLINIVGNCIGVFVLHAGVAGVAWPSFVSRSFSAAVITVLCFSQKNTVQYLKEWIFRLDAGLQKKILRIAVPNGVESGVFQLVKVALSSVAALFGTYQIAANGVAQSVWSMASLVCVTMGPVFITVIGQCMGAGEIEQAEHYFKKLTGITVLFAFVWNGLVFAATPVLMSFYALEPETKRLTVLLVLIHNIFNAAAFPFADSLGKGLRATGDILFTTVVSLVTTIGVRLVFSVIFGIRLNLGVIGIAWAMCLDWVIRGAIFWWRFYQGKWKQYKII